LKNLCVGVEEVQVIPLAGISRNPIDNLSSVSCYRRQAMSNQDQPDQAADVRERITSLIRATEHAHKKEISVDELQTLKTAASRLDEMLKAAEDADSQALRSAAARLDQLLADIDTGRDVTRNFKRRQDGEKT